MTIYDVVWSPVSAHIRIRCPQHGNPTEEDIRSTVEARRRGTQHFETRHPGEECMVHVIIGVAR